VKPTVLVVTDFEGYLRSMILCHLKGRMPLLISDQ